MVRYRTYTGRTLPSGRGKNSQSEAFLRSRVTPLQRMLAQLYHMQVHELLEAGRKIRCCGESALFGQRQ